MWTRREFHRALLAGAALPILAGPGLAKQQGDWAEALRVALQSRVMPGQGARFAIAEFTLSESADGVEMQARVTLDWAPGQRRRLVSAQGPHVEAAYRDMERAALAAYDQTCIGPCQ